MNDIYVRKVNCEKLSEYEGMLKYKLPEDGYDIVWKGGNAYGRYAHLTRTINTVVAPTPRIRGIEITELVKLSYKGPVNGSGKTGIDKNMLTAFPFQTE